MSAHQRVGIEAALFIFVVALAACTSHPELKTPVDVPTSVPNSSDPTAISPATSARAPQLVREGRLTSYVWAQNAPRLAIGSTAGIIIYDTAARREVRFIETQGEMGHVALSPDGQVLAASDLENSLMLWDVTTDRLLYTLRVDSPSPNSLVDLAFSQDGQQLATADGGAIRIWDLATGRLLYTLQEFASYPFGVDLVFSPDGRQLAAAADKVIRVWDLATGHKVQAWPVPDNLSLTFVSDQILATRKYPNANLSLWDAATAQMLSSFDTPATWVLTPDKVVLTASAHDTTIELQEIVTGQNSRTLQGHVKPEAWGLAFSSDGKTLAVGGLETIEVWDVTTGRQLHQIKISFICCRVYHLLFSPDGQMLVFSASDTIRLWDVATGGRELQRVLPGPGFATQVAFAPDQKTLTVAYDVETGPHTSKYVIKLWDVTTGQGLVTFDVTAEGRVQATYPEK